ncbi:YybH family protein [Paraburkholderia sp. BCC1885]|uniref:YybH family protein n=1 Tax=Paraburkholderia sp. BCC1885 TaxID=2562669 RepID=UPI00118269EB|nr:nuclear transport factor 2 family protein [Paraburkholderia sp. BCC1885]
MDTTGNPILQVLKDYQAAVFAKDVDAFVALYDEDLTVFDMWGTWAYRGLASWREMAAGWFSSLGTERVVVEFNQPESVVAQELAVVHVFVTYKGVTANGVVLRSLDNRMTLTLRLKADGWKVFHEHTSAPIDFETTKAIFKHE